MPPTETRETPEKTPPIAAVMEKLEAERGRIDWGKISNWLDRKNTEFRKKLNVIVTGNPEKRPNATEDPDYKTLVYLLYTLETSGSQSAEDLLDRFRLPIDEQSASDGRDITAVQESEIPDYLYDEDISVRRIAAIRLQILRQVAATASVKIPDLLKNISSRNVPQDRSQFTDELERFILQLRQRIYPLRADRAVYQIIYDLYGDKKKEEQRSSATRDFVRLAVLVDRDEPQIATRSGGFIEKIAKTTGIRLTLGNILKKVPPGLREILTRALKPETRGALIELSELETAELSKLLGYFRLKLNQLSGKLTENSFKLLNELIKLLEDILIENLKNKILTSNPQTIGGLFGLHSFMQDEFYDPVYAAVDDEAGVEEELRNIKLPA